MDRHPLTTPNSALTDALNATFYTSNGNEGILQNDMGNTLIQDSTTGQIMQLREGFVPVGIKEHGGVLYIASADKNGNGELGTIPSPIITWDFINSNKFQSKTLADGNTVYENIEISSKLYPGELYTIVLNLSQWDVINQKYICKETVLRSYGRDIPYLTLVNQELPLISSYSEKGYYKINLYASNEYNNYLLTPNESQIYLLKGDSNRYASDYWFIPQQLINGSTLDSKYMQLEGLHNVYPGTIPAGKLTLSVGFENIKKFELVKRAGGVLVEQQASYLPYTYAHKEDNGNVTYYTYFSSFRYQSDSSVRIRKLKIQIIEEKTRNPVDIYIYNNGGYFNGEHNCGNSLELVSNDLPKDVIKVDTIAESGNNIYPYIINNEEDPNEFITVLKTFNNGELWFYITKKILTSNEFNKDNNTHYSFSDLNIQEDGKIDTDKYNPNTGREGLFYIKSEENNKWYQANIEYYDQTDRYLGTYQVKFNPYFNDYEDISYSETEPIIASTYLFAHKNKQTVYKNEKVTFKSESVSGSSILLKPVLKTKDSVTTISKFESTAAFEKDKITYNYEYLFNEAPTPNTKSIEASIKSGTLDYPSVVTELHNPKEDYKEIYTYQKMGMKLLTSDGLKQIADYCGNDFYISTGKFIHTGDPDYLLGSIPQDIIFNNDGLDKVQTFNISDSSVIDGDNKKPWALKGFKQTSVNNVSFTPIVLKEEKETELLKFPELSEQITITDLEKNYTSNLYQDHSASSTYPTPGVKIKTKDNNVVVVLKDEVGYITKDTGSYTKGTFQEGNGSLITMSNGKLRFFNKLSKSESHTVQIMLQSQFDLICDKLIYTSTFMGEDGFYKFVKQFNYEYKQIDEKGVTITKPGNLLDGNPKAVTLELINGKVKNYAIINNTKSTKQIDTEKYNLPKHSIVLNYFTPSNIEKNSLSIGKYIVNAYEYKLVEKSIKRGDFLPGVLKLTIGDTTIKLVSGEPKIISITKDNTEWDLSGNMNLTAFGIYKIENVEIDSNDTVIDMFEYNQRHSKDNLIILQLAETYTEKASCLGMEYDYSYSPEEAYQINTDLSGKTYTFYKAEDSEDKDTTGRTIRFVNNE